VEAPLSLLDGMNLKPIIIRKINPNSMRILSSRISPKATILGITIFSTIETMKKIRM
jgi:hypothetical protein